MSDNKPHQFTSLTAQWRNNKPLAREMRHKPTPAEDALWQCLRNRKVNGAKFRRQHSIGGFIVDFVCIPHKLIIEVDGSIHDEPEQKIRDIERQELLEANAYHILRFTNDDVLNSIERVIETISTALAEIQQAEVNDLDDE